MSRIDQYAETTSPPDSFELVGNDPTDTSMGPNGTTKRVSAANFLKGSVKVLQPSGDDSGATDVAAINEVVGNNGVCVLAQAPLNGTPYFVNTPVNFSDQSALRGAVPWSSSGNDSYGPAGSGTSGGTTIFAVNFSGAAILNLTNSTSTQYTGVAITDICIEGFSTGGSGCHGILIDGAWGAGFIDGVCVHRPDQDCLHFGQDATSGDNPDEWVVTRTKLSAARNGYGVFADNLPDSVFTDVNSSENNLDGWNFNWSTNTRLTDCKSENNGGAGYHLVGQGYPNAAMGFFGCTTHLNNQDGWFFDNPNTNPNGRYVISGGFSIDDGQAGGTVYGSFRTSGSPAAIQVSNYFATGAAYGAYHGGSSFGLAFDGCSLAGTTAATHDDGTNTHALIANNAIPW